MEGFALIGALFFLVEPTLGPAFALGDLAAQVNRAASIVWGFRVQVPVWGQDALRLRIDSAGWSLRPGLQSPEHRDDPYTSFRSYSLDYLWRGGRRGWYAGAGLDRDRWDADSVVARGTGSMGSTSYETEDRRRFDQRSGWGGTRGAGRSWPAFEKCAWTVEGRLTAAKGLSGRTETMAAVTVGFAWRPWEPASSPR